MAKLTAWYPGTVKPVRNGVYQRDMPNGNIAFAYWNGMRWFSASREPILAIVNMAESLYDDLPWRGIYRKGGK